MHSKSFAVNSQKELAATLQTWADDNFRPTAAVVFAPIDEDFESLRQLFDNQKITFIGCSSAGEICDGQTFEGQIVGLGIDLDPTAFSLFSSSFDDGSVYSSAFAAGKEAAETFKNPAILMLSGGIRIDAEQLVFGAKDALGRDVPIYGGQAGDDLRLTRTLAFSNEFVSDNGIVCLIFDGDRVELKGMATCGWEPIGATNTITEADGNVLKSINGEPALDVFLKYFGFFSNDKTNEIEVIPTISAQYPLQIERPGGQSVLRTPIFVDRDARTMTLGGGVRTGEKFRFSIAPGFEVIDTTIRAFDALQKTAPEADAVILFSCKGRHSALGPLIDDEVEGLHNIWRAPMIGFFTYGEIGNLPNSSPEFHNDTCSLVTLRERI